MTPESTAFRVSVSCLCVTRRIHCIEIDPSQCLYLHRITQTQKNNTKTHLCISAVRISFLKGGEQCPYEKWLHIKINCREDWHFYLILQLQVNLTLKL